MHSTLIPILFWLSLALLFHAFIGYPLLMLCLARLAEPNLRPPTSDLPLPQITVVLAAHNEESRIAARLQNLLTSDYPKNKLAILVVADGCTDATISQIQTLAEPRLHLLIEPQRLGKASAINRALAAATGDIIIFADVRQRFTPEAITRLVRHFNNLQTGAVSGQLIIETATSATGSGVDTYWKIEKILRRAEALWDSSIGCTGAIYAIRRNLFQPIPTDTILDDVVIPMQIAQQGYRIAFEPAATAYDPQTLEPEREQIRKRRTLAGNYQMLCRHPAWLLPWRHRLWWQLISHKYLRLAAPFLLISLFATNTLLLGQKIFWLPILGQILFYSLAIYGLKHTGKKNRLLSLPAGFIFLNWMALSSLWHFLRNRNSGGWELASHTQPTGHV